MARTRRDIVIGLEALDAGQRVLDFSKLEIAGPGEMLLRDSLRMAIENELVLDQIDALAGEDGGDIDVHAKGAAHVKG
jgi:hypothetical protein